MAFPFSSTIFHTQLLWHQVAEPLALFVGFRYYLLLRKRNADCISDENRLYLLLAAMSGALVGSRLVGGLEDVPLMMRAPNIWLHFYHNKTVLGGLLGGLAGVELVKRILGERSNSGDIYVYPILLALIIGRVGCFSMGIYEETYGIPTTWPTGMDLGDAVPRHPVTLYEIAFLCLLWCSLYLAERKLVLANGLRFKLLMIAYCLFRFVLDFIKPGWRFAGLSTIQVAALSGLIYYGWLWFRDNSLFSITQRNQTPDA